MDFTLEEKTVTATSTPTPTATAKGSRLALARELRAKQSVRRVALASHVQ